MSCMSTELSQQDVLLYRRAASETEEVVRRLAQVRDHSWLQHRAAELAIDLQYVLRALLELPVEPDPRPLSSRA